MRRPWRHLARRTALALLPLLVLGTAFVVVQFNRAPSLAPYAALSLPAAVPGVEGVRVRFGGVSTLVFDDGETAWMTDGFFSRPGALATLARPIGPDPARIDAALRRLGVERLAAVIPVHTHYDHAMDSPQVALRTGAVLIGAESALNVGRGQGLPPAQLRAVAPGEVVVLGKFSIRFIASRHSPTPYSDGRASETIDAPLVPPRHASAWREGTVWSLAVTHASGARFLVQGSAGYVPGALAGVRADTVFLGIGTLGRKDEPYRTAYWAETVRAVGARRVIPVHWDDFSRPLDEPLRAMPLLLDDFDAAMADLLRQGARDGVEVRLPPLYQPFRP